MCRCLCVLAPYIITCTLLQYLMYYCHQIKSERIFLLGCHVVILHSTKILLEQKLHISLNSITIPHFSVSTT